MENEKYKKMFFVLIIILILGSLIIFGYYQYNKIGKQEYQRGLFDGQIYVIQLIEQTQKIPYLTNATGQITIEAISIKDLCKGVNEK